EAGHAAQQRRLAAAGGAQDGEELAGVQLQGDLVERGDVAEPLAHADDLDGVRGRAGLGGGAGGGRRHGQVHGCMPLTRSTSGSSSSSTSATGPSGATAGRMPLRRVISQVGIAASATSTNA